MGFAYMDGSLVIMENPLHFNKIQKMVEDVIGYLILGMLLTMFVDYWTYKLEIEEAKFTNSERFVSVILWPLIVLTIIIEIIRRNNKDE